MFIVIISLIECKGNDISPQIMMNKRELEIIQNLNLIEFTFINKTLIREFLTVLSIIYKFNIY